MGFKITVQFLNRDVTWEVGKGKGQLLHLAGTVFGIGIELEWTVGA